MSSFPVHPLPTPLFLPYLLRPLQLHEVPAPSSQDLIPPDVERADARHALPKLLVLQLVALFAPTATAAPIEHGVPATADAAGGVLFIVHVALAAVPFLVVIAEKGVFVVVRQAAAVPGSI